MEETGGGSSDDGRNTCPRGHWRPAEDEKLRQLVEQYGPQNWNSIAEKLQGRSGMLPFFVLINYLSLYIDIDIQYSKLITVDYSL